MAEKPKIIRGSTFKLDVTISDKDGVPFNLTWYTAYFTLKKWDYQADADDTDAILQQNVTVHTDPTQGETQFSFPPVDTKDLELWADFYYNINIKSTSGEVLAIKADAISIIANVTTRSAV